MKSNNTRRGFTQEIINENKGHCQKLFIKCHLQGILSEIPTLLKIKSGGDSRYQHSGMTPLFNPPSPGTTCRPLPPGARKTRCGFVGQALPDNAPVKGHTTRGFTLIELLVVVLIIGILAAVALPQYQKSVKKAKYAEMLSIITPLAKAAKSYYLQTNAHPTSLEDLDIDIPGLNSNGCLKNGICVFLETATGRIYAASGAQCASHAYYGGKVCNGYIYQMQPYGIGASIKAQPGIYCFQSVAWNATTKPDGMCQGEVAKSDANGTLHNVI